ncbi:unnamed protein product [Discosporangium mesarthrocarpum]
MCFLFLMVICLGLGLGLGFCPTKLCTVLLPVSFSCGDQCPVLCSREPCRCASLVRYIELTGPLALVPFTHISRMKARETPATVKGVSTSEYIVFLNFVQ